MNDIIITLSNLNITENEKLEAYSKFNLIFKNDDADISTTETDNIDQILSLIISDINSKSVTVVQAALQSLGFCLYQPELCRKISVERIDEIFVQINEAINQSSDKVICTKALWCLSKQQLPSSSLEKHIKTLLLTIENSMKNKKFQSVTIENEALNAIVRFLDQDLNVMIKNATSWVKLVYPLLVHSVSKIRERALQMMESHISQLYEEQDIASALICDLDAMLVDELAKLMSSKQEIHALRVWCVYVTLLGKKLHHGSVINLLLPIIEQAFKNPSSDVKVAAYKSWKTLIDNFALDPKIISDKKRVKLIMQVFRINNSKYQEVAMEKLNSWWHFLFKLDHQVTSYFDQVCIPLINFCFGSAHKSDSSSLLDTPTNKSQSAQRISGFLSPIVSKSKLMLNSPGQPNVHSHSTIQMLGCEILYHFLGSSSISPKPILSLVPLMTNIFSDSEFFAKQSSILVSSTLDAFMLCGNSIPEILFNQICYSLMEHLAILIEKGYRKEISKACISCQVFLKDIADAQVLSPERILVFLTSITKNLSSVLSLPTSYCGSSAADVMSGSLTPYLFEVLLNQRIVETQTSQDCFYEVAETLIGQSTPLTNLNYFQRFLQTFEERINDFECADNAYRLWLLIVSQLLIYINKTSEVNQGDVLEHDFTCLHLAASLPLTHIIPRLSFTTQKLMLKHWSDLYKTFARLSSMVTNVEVNVCCEEFCSKLIEKIQFNEQIKETTILSYLQILQVILESVDFSSFGVQFIGAMSSPLSFQKKRQRPLGNLHSFVQLTISINQCIAEYCDEISADNYSFKKSSAWNNAMICFISLLHELFTNITQSSMITALFSMLSQPIATYLDGVSKKNKMYTSSSLLHKIDEVWAEVGSLLTNHYKGSYDSDFLEVLSPLFVKSLTNSRRSIKQQANDLWRNTFEKANLSLKYPENLVQVLNQVKDKRSLHLPGWEAKVTSIEETPASQFSQGDTMPVPQPNIIGFPSPTKNIYPSSFINKSVSPKVRNSPLKQKNRKNSPSLKKTERSLPLSNMRDDEFVVIETTPKKKQILTAHQKEVMREKRELPVMYNNLDKSIDTSLMSQFDADSQFSQGLSVENCLPVPKFTFTPPKKQKLDEEISFDDSKVKDVSHEKENKNKSVKTTRRSVRFFEEDIKVLSPKENSEPVSPKTSHSSPSFKNLTKSISPDEKDRDCSEGSVKSLLSSLDSQLLSSPVKAIKSTPKKKQKNTTTENTCTIDTWLKASPKQVKNKFQQHSDKPEKFVPLAEDSQQDNKLLKVSTSLLSPDVTVVEDTQPYSCAAQEHQNVNKSPSYVESNLCDATDVIITPPLSPSNQSDISKVTKDDLQAFVKMKRLSTETLRKVESFASSPSKHSICSSQGFDVFSKEKQNNIKPYKSHDLLSTAQTKLLKQETEPISISSTESIIEVMSDSKDVPTIDLTLNSLAPQESTLSITDVETQSIDIPESNKKTSFNAQDSTAKRTRGRPPKKLSKNLNKLKAVSQKSSLDSVLQPESNNHDEPVKKRRSRRSLVNSSSVIEIDEVNENNTQVKSVKTANSITNSPLKQTRSKTRQSLQGLFDQNKCSSDHLKDRVEQFTALSGSHNNNNSNMSDVSLSSKLIHHSDKVVENSKQVSSTEDFPKEYSSKVNTQPDTHLKHTLSEDFSKHTSLKDSPKHTSLENSPKHTSLEDSPKHTLSGNSPKHTSSKDFPKHTSLKDSPKHTSSKDSPKHTSLEDSPKHTSLEDSPKHTSSGNSPKHTSSEDSPKHTSLKDSPKHTSSEDSPKHTSSEGSLKHMSSEGCLKDQYHFDSLFDNEPPASEIEQSNEMSPDVSDAQLSASSSKKNVRKINRVSPFTSKSYSALKSKNYHSLDSAFRKCRPKISPRYKKVTRKRKLGDKMFGSAEKQLESECLSENSQSPDLQQRMKTMFDSPPKEISETPTSTTKFLSRAGLILEKARLISLSKSDQASSLSDSNLNSAVSVEGNGTGFNTATKLDSELSHTAQKSCQSPLVSEPNSKNVLSPGTSPSGGILKKRPSETGNKIDSPSPNNRRRVCFSESVEVTQVPKSPRQTVPCSPKPVNRCLELPKSTNIPTSPLVNSSSMVTSNQTKFVTTPIKFKSNKLDKDFDTLQDSTSQSMEPELVSSCESQLNNSDPICPFLLDCDNSLDSILPQLTSSIWVRGLEQLFYSKGICTISHLAALTEVQVNSLPISSPKVTTLLNALKTVQQTKKCETDSAVQESLPLVEDELEKLSPAKGQLMDDSIELITEDSDLELDAAAAATDNHSSNLTQNNKNQARSISRQPSMNDAIKEFKSCFTLASLKCMKSRELVKIHEELNVMMSTVVLALKSQCPLSPGANVDDNDSQN